jgi:16S rRNA (uracil1498-N3)-methyltransferase
MDYFYCSPQRISTDTITIDGDEFAHMTHVMRKVVGDAIRVVDGRGRAYDVTITAINKKIARGTILRSYEMLHEPKVFCTLAVGVLKNPSKFDFLIEKVTELGVSEIIPMRTERTIPSHARIDRWQKLALAAMKQSGRSYLPTVRDLSTFEEILEESDVSDDALKLVAHEQPGNTPETVLTILRRSYRRAIILVGPEGGFTEKEFEEARRHGFVHLSLGPRRLRTETAAIVVTSLLL